MSKTDYSKHEQDAAKQLFRETERAITASMREGYQAKPVKFLGMEMDPMFGAIAQSAYNLASHQFGHWFGQSIYARTDSLVARQLERSTAKKVAAGTTFLAALALKSGAYIQPIITSWGNHARARSDIAKKIAPILDEVKGSHSMLSLMRVSAKDNEMIYAHCRRMAKIASSENLVNYLRLGINSGANLISDTLLLHGMWTHQKGPNDLAAMSPHYQQPSANQGHAPHATAHGGGFLQQMVNLFTGPVSEKVENDQRKKLAETLSGYSALDMVVRLEEEIANNAKAKTFKPPGRNSRELSLEGYIEAIMVQHQKDMAQLDPEYSEIRQSLHEDLALVAKPLAKAVRSGQMNALELIRLIGEGHIIKAQGRVIASAEEVEALIERGSGQGAQHLHQNPKDYYATSNFTKEDLKAAFHALEGEDRMLLASWFSDAVLEDAGIDSKEIKCIRDATCQHYDRLLLGAFMGVAAKSDEELKGEGLAVSEIRHVREAQKKIAKEGHAHIHDLRETPANPHGIERILANLAAPQILKDREYLGKLIARGQEVLIAQAAEQEDVPEEARKIKEKQAYDGHHHANDNASNQAHADTPTKSVRGKAVHDGHVQYRERAVG